MAVRMFNDSKYRIIPTKLHPGASIGLHKQESGDDINYILSGTGKVICDGKKKSSPPAAATSALKDPPIPSLILEKTTLRY